MPHDLLIRNGTVVDGTGAPAYQADVAVAQGRITEIGRFNGSASRVTASPTWLTDAAAQKRRKPTCRQSGDRGMLKL